MTGTLAPMGERKTFTKVEEKPGNFRLKALIVFSNLEAMLRFPTFGLGEDEQLRVTYIYPDDGYGKVFVAILEGVVGALPASAMASSLGDYPGISHASLDLEHIGIPAS